MRTRAFYTLIGITAGALLLALYYAFLRLNSSLGLLYAHNTHTYFAVYILLTLGTVVLFGINMALLTYQWRHYGLGKLLHVGGSGSGAILGLIASSCPVCGSAAFTILGLSGGLSSLPFQGLEIKVVSLALLGFSVGYSVWWLRKKGCTTVCPPERDDRLRPHEYNVLPTLALATCVLLLFAVTQLRTDTLWSKTLTEQSYRCARGSTL